MLDTVQFDMGGTLEDIWYNEETAERAARGLLDLLEQHGLTVFMRTVGVLGTGSAGGQSI